MIHPITKDLEKAKQDLLAAETATHLRRSSRERAMLAATEKPDADNYTHLAWCCEQESCELQRKIAALRRLAAKSRAAAFALVETAKA